MTYKSILLSALLLPIASYGRNTEVRIKELKEAQFQKGLELSNLGKMIAERDELIRTGRKDLENIFPEFKKYRALALEKNNKKLTEKEIAKVGENIQISLGKFVEQFDTAIKEKASMKQFLTQELFDQENPTSTMAFESLRFIVIRTIFERMLLEILVGKHATCAEELIKINQELSDLTQ